MKKCRIKDAFKKMVATLLVLAMCVGMHPFRAEAEGEEQITLTYDGFYTQGGYRIGLNVNFLDGDGIIDFSTKRSMWIVDGVEKEMTPSVVYYTKMSETSLQLLIPYAEIQPGVPNGYAVGTHWFSIPAGTVIGNMITTNTISFRINAAEVTPLIETSVSCTEYGTEGGSNQRYRFTLDVPGLPNSSYEKKEGVFHSTDIIVDGNSKSGVTYYRPDASANSTAMNLYVPYALIEDNITTSTAIQKEHLLTIKKGTWLGDLLITNDVYLRINAGGTVNILDSYQEVEVTEFWNRATSTAGNLYFCVSPEDALYTDGWEKYFGSCIYVDGDLRTDIPVIKENGYYNVALGDKGITAIAGETVIQINGVLSDNNNHMVEFQPATFKYRSDDKWYQIKTSQDMTIESVGQPYYNTGEQLRVDMTMSANLPAEGNYYFSDAQITNAGDAFAYSSLYGYGLSNGTMMLIFEGVTEDEYNSIPDGAVLTFNGGSSTFVSKAGDEINIETSFTLKKVNGEWKQQVEDSDVQEVGVIEYFNRNTSNADSLYFSVSPADNLYTDGWEKYFGSCIYINGTLREDIPVIKIAADSYCLGLIDASASATAGETVIQINGVLCDNQDNMVKFQPATFKYRSDGKWYQIKTSQDMTIESVGQPYYTQSSLRVDLTMSAELPLVDNTYYFSNAQITNAGDTFAYSSLYGFGLTNGTMMLLFDGVTEDEYNSIPDGAVLTFNGGSSTFVSKAGDEINVNTSFELTKVDGRWINKDNVKTGVLSSDAVSTDEIRVKSLSEDGLPYNASAKIGYTGVVYLNDTLQNSVNLYKITADTYVLKLSQVTSNPTDGMKITIKGMLTDGFSTMKYLPITYSYSEVTGQWTLTRHKGTGVDGDANSDGVFDIRDIVRVKYEEIMGTNASRLASEDATYETALGNFKTNLKKLYEKILTIDGELPIYLDDEYIQLGAYNGPLSAGATIYENGRVIGTMSRERSQEDFELFAASGLNTLIGGTHISMDGTGDGYQLLNGSTTQWFNLLGYVEQAGKAGIDVIVGSEALNCYLDEIQAVRNDGSSVDVTDDFLVKDLRQMLTGYIEHDTGKGKLSDGLRAYSNFKGLMMSDELELEHLDAYQNAHRIWNTLAPNIPTFTSQLPGQNEEYIRTSGVAAGNYCYDRYPLKGDNTVFGNWLKELELVASTGKANKFPTGITLQAYGQYFWDEASRLREPSNKDDIGFQVYTSLAYGMKTINYYTYAPIRNQTEDNYCTNTMVTYKADGTVETTDIYDSVQKINKEILQFDHVFLDFDWQGTITGKRAGSSSAVLQDLTPYTDTNVTLENQTIDTVVGCMYDPDKKLNGYWIVNAENPYNDKNGTATVAFKGAKKAIVYDPAQNIYGEVVTLTNNQYTATLGSGEGQFIIPLP